MSLAFDDIWLDVRHHRLLDEGWEMLTTPLYLQADYGLMRLIDPHRLYEYEWRDLDMEDFLMITARIELNYLQQKHAATVRMFFDAADLARISYRRLWQPRILDHRTDRDGLIGRTVSGDSPFPTRQ